MGSRIFILRNSINTSRHIINFIQLFFYRSIENFLSIDKFFNIILKIRGVPIIIIRRISIGLTIIIIGITRKRPRIKITSISIVIEIFREIKFTSTASLFCSIKVDKGTSLKSTGALLLETNFIRSSTFSLKEFISST